MSSNSTFVDRVIVIVFLLGVGFLSLLSEGTIFEVDSLLESRSGCPEVGVVLFDVPYFPHKDPAMTEKYPCLSI